MRGRVGQAQLNFDLDGVVVVVVVRGCVGGAQGGSRRVPPLCSLSPPRRWRPPPPRPGAAAAAPRGARPSPRGGRRRAARPESRERRRRRAATRAAPRPALAPLPSLTSMSTVEPDALSGGGRGLLGRAVRELGSDEEEGGRRRAREGAPSPPRPTHRHPPAWSPQTLHPLAPAGRTRRTRRGARGPRRAVDGGGVSAGPPMGGAATRGHASHLLLVLWAEFHTRGWPP